MIINYLKTALRNFARYRGFAIINIISLTIGIVGCLIIGLFVWDELQYDKGIPEGESIYRIYEERKAVNATTYLSSVPPAYADFLKEQYPEVELTARILMIGDKYLLEANEKSNYEEKGLFVEDDFIKIFNLKFIAGNPDNALDELLSVVISKEIAERYFGDENPVGQTIQIDKSSFVIKGVFEKPDHFHRDFNYLMSLSSAGIDPERMKAWTWHQFYTYVKFKPGTNVAEVEKKFQNYVIKEVQALDQQVESEFLPYFQALKNIHLQSANFMHDTAIRGNESYVKALSIIAVFVFFIACFNFINLATARSFKRAKEIGIRKAIGAYRKQIVVQFISETVLLSFLSMILAMIITVFLVPSLNSFTGKSIEFNPFMNIFTGLLFLAASIVIGILAGLYPALVLSYFKPVKVLKSMKLTEKGLSSAWLRKSLIVIQFAISVLLIICTMVVYRQTVYFNNKDLGFNKEHVVHFQVRGTLDQKLETFKAELKRSPSIISVTSGYGLPGDPYAGDGIKIPGDNGQIEYPSNVFIGDHDYLNTLGLRLVAGRDFSREVPTDIKEAFIINETAVKHFGFDSPEDALGKQIYWTEWEPADTLEPIKKGKVIGIVQDFHYQSLHEKVTASVIQLYPQVLFKVAVRIKPGATEEAITDIQNLWKQYVPEYPLDYRFMDESFGMMYNNEEKLSQLLWYFAIMAIIIGCLGLFALAALSAEERTKEIGIRKAMGANALQIMTLLSKNFLILVLLASAIAIPIAWISMSKWLEGFAYRINIEWWVFLLALVVTVLIALITTSFQTIRVAKMKPVKALRTE